MEQSIILSSWTVSPRNCVVEQKSECEPVITPAINHNLDSRPMEGDNLPGASGSGGLPRQLAYGGGSYKPEIRVGVGDNSGR